MANDLPALSVRRPYLAVVLNLLIVVAGISAIFGVEVRELPDVDRPIVTVRADYPGGSPETIDAEVTSVVEGAVARVNGVVEVRSSSEENNFRVRVVFRPSVDLITAANDVREAVSRVQRRLPEGVEELSVIKADADSQAIIRLAVFSDKVPIEDVTRKVENEIIPELISVDGVADVTLFGKRERVMRVVLDPMRMAGYRLSVTDVVNVLKNARYDVPAGSFKSHEQEVIVRANASVKGPQAIEDLIVRDPVRIGDVGHALFSPADASSIVRLDGKPVVNLGIIRRAQSNTVSISRDVAKVTEKLNARLANMQIVTVSDDSTFIKGAITEVLISLSLAVLIVVTVIALFVGQIRLAFIPAIAIPVALIGTIAAIWLLGFSLNLITLLALVLATGIVVDDAIVVLENIQRFRSQGMGPSAAAVIGTRQVFFAVIATTATLVSVFAPISFLPSTAGRLFGEFGFVLAVAVCVSSFTALTVVPMLAARQTRKVQIQRAGNAGILVRAGGLISAGYARLLDGVLRVPLAVLGVCLIVIVGALMTYQTLGEELVPEEDRGLITVRLTGPDGVGLDYTDRQVEKVEAVLQPLVDEGTATKLFTITGRYDPNRGQLDAPLRDWSERSRGEGEIARTVNRELAKIPGARAMVRRGNSLGLRNANGGIRFALTGTNYETIADAADTFAVALEQKVPQVENLRVEFRATQPQLSVSIDRRRATDLGVSLDGLAATVQVLVDNDEVAELTIDDERVPVILEAKAGAIDDPSDLRNIYVGASDGRLVPLSQLVTFSEYAVAAELDRHGQRRAVEVFGDTTEGYSLREAVNAVQELSATELPDGIGLLFLDEAAALNETSYGVLITYMVALLIVFLVLMAQFESVTSALVILLTVPVGICAAVFALGLTGTTINIYSQIGILMLIGIMAKNAILMVEFADQLREEGKDVLDAIREASCVRLRPIAMTMISTVLAGLPLILGGGPGVEARAAIGWVVFGGLGLAAIFTLFLTPALYVLIAGLMQPRNARAEVIAREINEAGPLIDAESQ
ncbi:MAG: efflux RND transporter permease subunit [Rhizobiales bacterium]|nr:efflux RND transporter permease subunit [Hyphomicrobiales bacterium]